MDYEAIREALGGAIPFNKHIGLFAEHLAGLTPLARSASISYLKIAKGPVEARASLGGSKDDLLAALDADGRVEFPVEVSLRDSSDVEVARMTVDWHVRRNS